MGRKRIEALRVHAFYLSGNDAVQSDQEPKTFLPTSGNQQMVTEAKRKRESAFSMTDDEHGRGTTVYRLWALTSRDSKKKRDPFRGSPWRAFKIQCADRLSRRSYAKTI
jgi:hypothetical protein